MTEQEARAEALRRWPGHRDRDLNSLFGAGREGFIAGAAWERARLSPRVAAPSDTDQEALIEQLRSKVWNESQPVQVKPWKSEHLERAERVGDALNGVLVDAGIFDSDAVEEYNDLVNDLVNAVLAALGGDHAE